jgi:hypothetical protein
LSLQVVAQERKSSNPAVDKRVEDLKVLVGLDEAQTTQVRAIYAESEQKESVVNANNSLSETDKKAAIEKIKQEESAAIDKVMNETQRKKWDENSGNEPQKANINTSRSNIKQEN